MHLSIPLTSRSSDGKLRVIISARISQPTQDPDAMEAQHEDSEKWLKRNYTGEATIEKFAEQISGWKADRASIREILRRVKSGEVDVVIVNELREIYRNPEFQWRFIHKCVDGRVRLICIGDGIDTATETWETMAHVGVMRAGMFVPETRRRVQRKANYSFSKGGMLLRHRYGYRRLTKEEASSGEFGPPGLRIVRVPECTEVIKSMCRAISAGKSPDEVADWLNSKGEEVGPYVKHGVWTGRLVAGLLRDPILIGIRRFRDRVYTPEFETGNSRREKNAKPEIKHWPELAHLTEGEFDELQVGLNKRSIGHNQPTGADNPLYRKPRAWSLWPGQHAVCGTCRSAMHRYGKFMKCKNAVSKGPKTCWSHVQANIGVIHAKVLPWVLAVICAQRQVRGIAVKAAWDLIETERTSASGQENVEAQKAKRLDVQIEHITKAIQLGGDIPELVKKLQSLLSARDEALRRQSAVARPDHEPQFLTLEEVDARFEEAFMTLATKSHKFAELLRQLINRFEIVPVMALHCPQVRPRARLTLSTKPWTSDFEQAAEFSTEIDLFDYPVHIQHLEACLALRQAEPELGLRAMGMRLDIGYMTVKRALKYARLMQLAGVTSPYVELTERPAGASRWRKRARKQPPDQAA